MHMHASEDGDPRKWIWKMTPQSSKLWSPSTPSSAKAMVRRGRRSSRRTAGSCRVSTIGASRYSSTCSVITTAWAVRGKGRINMQHHRLCPVVPRGSGEASPAELLPAAGPGEEADGAEPQASAVWVGEDGFWQCKGVGGTSQSLSTAFYAGHWLDIVPKSFVCLFFVCLFFFKIRSLLDNTDCIAKNKLKKQNTENAWMNLNLILVGLPNK